VTVPEWAHVKELLHQAVALGPEARAKFLDEVCASNPALRAELESLLTVGDELSEGFLQSPPTDQFRAAGERLEAAGEGFGAIGLVAGQLFAQRFELIRKLGEGGMGQVWLAEQISPVRRPVALKLIRAGMYDETVLQRFESERQSLAIMDHPAIAKVFDAGATPQGQPYFVMEYVAGLPITEYCDQQKLSIPERLELFIQVCEGVQHAHQKAIIHRDLKPANILVIETDGRSIPRIIDFGLAKPTTPQAPGETLFTRFGQFMGTPGYMSPEQVDPNAQDIDTRTDVYSLGVVLYVLLTGQQPFDADRRKQPLDQWLRRLREEEPQNPSAKVSADRDTSAASAQARGTGAKQLVSLLRGDLDWITLKAVERDRERRYGTPSELAADLRRYLNHEPVSARPASAAYKTRKFIRRHRIAAAFIGMVTLLSIVASGAAVIAVAKQREAEYQATQALQAQSRLLTQAAAQRLKDSDVAGAQGIILEVLTNPRFAQGHMPAAISVFQESRAADTQLAVLSGQGDRVYSAAYSPDGTRIVTASEGKIARIWDAHAGKQLAVLSGHDATVSSAAYSPDGTRIVTASEDKTARIWDARSGKQLAVLSGHGNFVYAAAYSPDGTHIVTASEDKTARIWDARTGAQLTVLSGHDASVASATYSPDGTRIVTGSFDKTARIWDARTGTPLAVLSGNGNIVYSAEYSPDGTRIVTASADKTARIWDARSGKQLAVLSGHSDIVQSAAYSADGTRIVTSSSDKTARIWDAQTSTPLAVLSGHGNIVYSAAYSPDSTRIVTASADTTARIWDAGPGKQLAVLSGHDNFVYSAAYSPDGTRIVTASADTTARIWDARSGKQLAVLAGHDAVVRSAAFSPDATRIVTASTDKTNRIWDANSGKQLAVLIGHGNFVYSAAYSPDGTRIVTASRDKTARIWDAGSGKQLAALIGHGNFVYSAAYSPDGTRIVTASADKTARIWDARSGEQVAVLSGHGDVVQSAAYSPDNTRIVTASNDKTARIWDASTGMQLAVLSGHGDVVQSAAYSPDGTRIVTASQDTTARIWDARSGKQLAVLIGHGNFVYSAAYSPDGTRIVTASPDKTARIWDARVPAGIEAQITWDASAVTDPLSDVDRTQLGLPPDSRARTWSTDGSACDLAAAAFYDPDRQAAGVSQANINVDIASPACSEDTTKSGHSARSEYQMGRVLLAKGDVSGARRQFHSAEAKGYPAVRVDLADLLVNVSTRLDPRLAASLYEQAWRSGVQIAAFRLGHLYEVGLPASDGSASVAFQSDASKSWLWYRRGGDAGEPNALARFAERDENNALTETDPSKRNAQLLQAFTLYAAAAERAREEAWPDDVWRHWRYRRASLARVLAKEGMMQQVADAYRSILDHSTPGSAM
jgi:eukaryotic-like serine/threonine-protein kinase